MKSLKIFAFVGLAVLLGIASANAAVQDGNACVLINNLRGVFNTLRLLCFAGAAFVLAGWAWEFIKGGEAKIDEVKKKGVGLFVGFVLLFSIGIIMQFLPNMGGCLPAW